MRNNRYHFSDEFELMNSDKMYSVVVEGYNVRDEHDVNNWYTEIAHYTIVDEDNNLVTSEHYDFDELVEEIYARDYENNAEDEFYDVEDFQHDSDLY